METCIIVPPVRIAYKGQEHVEEQDVWAVGAGMENTYYDNVTQFMPSDCE